MKIEVQYNKEMYLDPLVTSITWSGDSKQAFRKLELQLSNTINGKEPTVIIEKGRLLRFLKDDKELFRGVIFSYSIQSDGNMSITAYDENIYLTKNVDTKKFTNMTASSIIKQLCNDFGISFGFIEDTGYVFPKLIMRNKTIWDMMNTAITETSKQIGRRFILISKEGKLQLIEQKRNVVEWVLQSGYNILNASYSESIEDLRNQVKVMSADHEDQPISTIVENQSLMQNYGLMQHIEESNVDHNASQNQQLANQLLKDLSKVSEEAEIEALGNEEVIAGSIIHVSETMTNLSGNYHVSTDTHTFQNKVHRMRLKIDNMNH
ncbi:XkdQ/YqbQ family protein [Chengkuizengella axinellae]|uniref:YqbQ/XkdQ domain-containing protein n=1 Tax=Chengkuizengella axinellae TaxID=3064388 RepID=A0ABT9J3Z1_9BACL|nr:hypothetical protein [Chengkuizengella sp. 2205SS18-9]MDP5275700.1 hypothetical protein [Chengkuizengella sp. 2205SS18-9]